ncbi:MAG: efflux RND transporter permease subunit [Bacteroidales bacterium]|nr:efflux RND transporter permease subunit [Bacteroidales bacterium]
MKLPKYAIENPQFSLILFFLLVVAGIVSFFTMPRTENPSIFKPGASIIVIYPGASPSDIEQLVAIPVEEAVHELEDIKKIETSVRDGFMSIAVEFTFGTDPKEKYDEVVGRVNDIKNSLPDEIYEIKTMRWGSGDVNILQLAFCFRLGRILADAGSCRKR